jgi:hypothetical protein
LAFLSGIIFFTRVDLRVDVAALFTVRKARETADFFFAFLVIVTSAIFDLLALFPAFFLEGN